jgi:Putative adhesin
MSDNAEETLRTQGFTTDGPITIDVQLSTGRLDIELSASAGEDAVQVDVRHDPASGQPWAQGLASAFSWVNEQFGDQFDLDLTTSGSAAVQQTRVEMQGSRLVVRPPKGLPMRHLPLAVTVRAPSGSAVDVRGASANVSITGQPGSVNITSTAGDVAIAGANSALNVRTGGGEVQVDDVASGTILTSTGSARVGTFAATEGGELTVRSGSGDVTVSDAAAGVISLRSGSGAVRVGLRAGVLAEVALSSGIGTVTSELEVSQTQPEGEPALRVTATSGSGDVTVTRGK